MKQHRFSSAAIAAAMAAGTLIQARTHDHAAFADPRQPINAFGDARGRALDFPVTRSFATYDAATFQPTGQMVQRTYDSTGAFLVGELERLDQTLHMPLASVTWQRDINLRGDVGMADDVSSFTLSSFGSAGNLGQGNGIRNGKAWIGKASDQIGGVSVDIGKTPFPLTPWGLELAYTEFELMAAAKLGRPVDQQKYEALTLKHAMDTDEMVYVGDGSVLVNGAAATGLVNNALVTNVTNVANPGGGTAWTTKTPQQILADFNEVLQSVWAASGYAVLPSKILLPPSQFGYLSTTLVALAGSSSAVSILTYIMENNIVTAQTKRELDIQPSKWLVGAGAGGTIGTANGHDRMVVYTQEEKYVRFPMVPLSRTPIQYDSIWHKCTYFGRLGCVEVVYPETMAYRDGI
jgi:hypothetical protein